METLRSVNGHVWMRPRAWPGLGLGSGRFSASQRSWQFEVAGCRLSIVIVIVIVTGIVLCCGVVSSGL
ncbi:hypothetical protein CFIMG_007723RA00001 [Ceratocystis fimbriata CBS 114723]|uniref:Uncharacterized protein n=1 Tax=Ceratocystis fimbriata CBS 114723 TaxID=1035309 RepID=A0A2C5WV16_9PEZI|nr:hypothetical protein CFIMG_007723RA00001 [Ceratocystis fimbriata CBS 114723]